MDQLSGYGMDFPGYVDIYPEVKLPIDLFERQIAKKDAIANKLMQDADALYQANLSKEGAHSKILVEEANKRLEPLRNMATEFMASGNMTVKDLRNQILQFRQTELNDPNRIMEREALARHYNKWDEYDAAMRNKSEFPAGYIFGHDGQGNPIQAQDFQTLSQIDPSVGAFIKPENHQIGLMENLIKSVISQKDWSSNPNSGIRWVDDGKGGQTPYIENEETFREYFTEDLAREKFGHPETLNMARKNYLAAHPHYAREFEGLNEAQADAKFLEDTIDSARGRFFDWNKTQRDLSRVPGGGRGKGSDGEDSPKGAAHTSVGIQFKQDANFTTADGKTITPNDVTIGNLDIYQQGVNNVYRNKLAGILAAAKDTGAEPVYDENNQIVSFRVPDNVPENFRARRIEEVDRLNAKLGEAQGDMLARMNQFGEVLLQNGLTPGQDITEQLVRPFLGMPVSTLVAGNQDLKKALRNIAKGQTQTGNKVAGPNTNVLEDQSYNQLLGMTTAQILNVLPADKARQLKVALAQSNPNSKQLIEDIKAEIEATDVHTMNSFSVQTPKLKADLVNSLTTVIGNKLQNSIIDLDTGKYLDPEEMNTLADHLSKINAGKTVGEDEVSILQGNDLARTMRIMINPNTGNVIPTAQITIGDKTYRIATEKIENVGPLSIGDGTTTSAEVDRLKDFYSTAAQSNYAYTRVGDRFIDIKNEGNSSGFRFFIPEVNMAYESSAGATATNVLRVMDGVQQLVDSGGTTDLIDKFIKSEGFTGVLNPTMRAWLETNNRMAGNRWAKEARVKRYNDERTGQAPLTLKSQSVEAVLGSEWKKGGPDGPTTSTAKGPGQFVEGTWLGQNNDGYLAKVASSGLLSQEEMQKVNQAKTRDEKLALRMDEGIAKKAAVTYMNDIRDTLLQSGATSTVSNWMLKLGYMFGPQRAVELVKANKTSPNTPITKFLRDDQLKANPEFLRGINTVADLVTKSLTLVGD